MKKLKVEKREASIFVKSTNSKNYPEIAEILCKGKKYPHLTNKEYEALPEKDKEFIDKRFSQLFSLSAKEWELLKVNEEINDDKVECQLCGNTNLRWISKLKNRNTEEVLIVGSDCIKNYKEFRGGEGESFEEMARQNNKIRNEQILEGRSPGIIRDMDRFRGIKKERKIIADYLIRKYDDLNKEVIRNSGFLSGKNISEDRINKFIRIHIKIKEFFEVFDEYIANKGIFSITDEIADWVTSQSNFDHELYRQLHEDGEITQRTIDAIEEPHFMKNTIPYFDELLKQNEIIRFKRLRNTTFAIALKLRPDILLNVRMSQFIKRYKNYLFDHKFITIDYELLIKNCTIDDQKSMLKSLDYIITNEFKKLFDLKEVNHRDNELAFRNRKNRIIYIVNYIDFINNFKELIFLDDKEHYSINLFNYINEHSAKYTPEEYEKHVKDLQGAKQGERN